MYGISRRRGTVCERRTRDLQKYVARSFVRVHRSFRVSYADVKHRVTSRRVALTRGEGEVRERRHEDASRVAHLPEVSAAPRRLD